MALLSRRRLLIGGASAAGLAALTATGVRLGTDNDSASAAVRGVEPFHGIHQAGIATEQQDRLLFATFDLTSARRDDVVGLLQEWTRAGARMAQGLDVQEGDQPPLSPPLDTGEAVGLDPAHLTLTFGFGPTLFTRDSVDRFGLAHKRPDALVDLPAFPGDQLEAERSGGDLCVQACGNDPQVLYHAVRNLGRIARGTAVVRWVQQGFGRTAATAVGQPTPRNLLGFKDGTNNLRSGTEVFDDNVWVRGGAAWMNNGSYMVVRRIRMHIEVWDRSSLADQEQTIGRTKIEGAPLGSHKEFDPIDLKQRGADGAEVIPLDAHVRLANQNGTGIHFLRRGYSFTDGTDPQTGQLDAGQFFIAYQNDPRAQFIPMQRVLAKSDALNEYIQHVASAVFAVPPGAAAERDYVGQGFFEG